LTEICPVCGKPAEKADWMTKPEGNGLLFVHGHEKRGQVHLDVGHFVFFDSDEYRKWEVQYAPALAALRRTGK